MYFQGPGTFIELLRYPTHLLQIPIFPGWKPRLVKKHVTNKWAAGAFSGGMFFHPGFIHRSNVRISAGLRLGAACLHAAQDHLGGLRRRRWRRKKSIKVERPRWAILIFPRGNRAAFRKQCQLMMLLFCLKRKYIFEVLGGNRDPRIVFYLHSGEP